METQSQAQHWEVEFESPWCSSTNSTLPIPHKTPCLLPHLKSFPMQASERSCIHPWALPVRLPTRPRLVSMHEKGEETKNEIRPEAWVKDTLSRQFPCTHHWIRHVAYKMLHGCSLSLPLSSNEPAHRHDDEQVRKSVNAGLYGNDKFGGWQLLQQHPKVGRRQQQGLV